MEIFGNNNVDKIVLFIKPLHVFNGISDPSEKSAKEDCGGTRHLGEAKWRASLAEQ